MKVYEWNIAITRRPNLLFPVSKLNSRSKQINTRCKEQTLAHRSVVDSTRNSPWTNVSSADSRRREASALLRVEERILQELGDHPRITRSVASLLLLRSRKCWVFLVFRYLGPSRDPDARGLLFEEASHGDLQRYLDDPKSRINHKLRLRWRAGNWDRRYNRAGGKNGRVYAWYWAMCGSI